MNISLSLTIIQLDGFSGMKIVGNQAFFEYKGDWKLEPIYNVVAASGFSVASSIVMSGLVGLREWNDIDSQFNKAYIDKSLAQSGYVMNATASQITNCILDEDVETSYHTATLDKDHLYLKGYSSFDPRNLSSTISDDILFIGNWPERLLLF